MKPFIKSKIGLVLLACLLLGGVVFLIVRMTGPSAAVSRERADAYFDEGKYDEARIEYMNVLRREPIRADVHARLGEIWLKQGVPLRAGPHLMEAYKLDPTSLEPEVYIELATVYLAYGKVPEAQRVALDVLAQEPQNMEALSFLVALAASEEQLQGVEERLEGFRDARPPGFSLVEAMVEARKGDQQGFALAIDRAVIEEPESAGAHMAKARLHESQRQWDQARTHYREASEHAEARSGERLALAQFLLRRGDLEGAEKEAAKVTAESPDYVPALNFYAQVALRREAFDEATKAVGKVLTRDPSNIEGRFIEVEILLAREKPDEALKTLASLGNTLPNAPRVSALLARAHMAKKDYTQAAVAVEEVIEAQPENTEAVLMHAELSILRNNPLAAIRVLEEFVPKHPEHTKARSLLNDAYRAAGRFDALEESLRNQVGDGEGSFAEFLQLGTALRQQNKLDEARAAFAKALEINPDHPGPVFNLCEVEILAENIPAALERIDTFIAKSPDLAVAYLMKARIHGIDENWDEAEAAGLRALEIDPELTAAHDLLVGVYASAGKTEEAISSLESFLETNKENVSAWYRLALLSGQRGDHHREIEAYETIVGLQADHVPAFNNLAVLYAQHRKDLPKAEAHAQKAYTLMPDNGEIADTLGWILFQRGQYQRGLTLVEQGERALPDNPEVLYHVGMAKAMMGDLKAAQSALEKATASEADFVGKENAAAQLARLTSPGDIAALEERLREEPGDLVARVQLGRAHEEQNDFAKAAEAYEAALEKNPALAVAATGLARLYAGPLADSEKALEYGTKARTLAPGDLEVAGILGRIAFQTGDFQRAYDLLQPSARQGTPRAEVLYDLAWATYSLGRVNDAREVMQRFAGVAPASDEKVAAERFLSLTDPQKAPDPVEAEGVLASDPGNVPALMVRAATASPEQAKSDYESVLARFPSFAPAQAGLAAILWDGDADSLERGYRLASKAREALPGDPQVARTLGIISYQRKNVSYARQLLAESARAGDLDPVGLYFLGRAQIDAQDRPAGLASLEKALGDGLEEPWASRARKAMDPVE